MYKFDDVNFGSILKFLKPESAKILSILHETRFGLSPDPNTNSV